MTIENVPSKPIRTKMAIKEQAEVKNDIERHKWETLAALIREQLYCQIAEVLNVGGKTIR